MHALFTVKILFAVSISRDRFVALPNKPNPVTCFKFVVLNCISLGNVISITHPISKGTGIENVRSIVASSLTVLFPSATAVPEEIVAAVLTVKLKLPESILPPSDDRVVNEIPVFAAVEIGFLILVTLNIHTVLAVILLLGFVLLIFRMSFENIQFKFVSTL